MIFSLDLGRVTGFALWDETMTRPMWGKRAFSDKLHIAQSEFDAFLSKVIAEYRVDTIAVESPYVDPKMISNVERGYMMRGLVFLAIGRRPAMRLLDVSSSEWRMHFLGLKQAPKQIGASENPKKRQSMRRSWIKKKARDCCEQRGWIVKSDDEADALGLLDYARAKLNPNYGTATTPLFADASA